MSLSEKKDKLMGAHIAIQIDHPQGQDILNEAFHRLARFEKIFSANDEGSCLQLLNRSAYQRPIQVDPSLFHLIDLGRTHSMAKGSFLNIALGPLVKLWGIGFDHAKKPSPSAIARTLQVCRPDQLILNPIDQSVAFEQAGMAIDLGALAKGYAADLCRQFLRSQGVSSALIDLGGNILTFGPHPHRASGDWIVGIQDPRRARGQHACRLKVQDQSVVTSGIYVRQFAEHGQVYHHIFDPSDGYPIQTSTLSLTIVSADSLDGEIWSSRLFGLPAQEIIERVHSLPENIQAIVIDNKGQLYYSHALKSSII